MKVKLPRKIKKTVKFCRDDYYARHSYTKIHSKLICQYPIHTVLYKILDYEYCVNNADKGYKPNWPEITKHRLFKVINYQP